jgi:ATP-dependent Clp protease ATP-binding subunit ClpX
MLGAFAYTDEMKTVPPKIVKQELMKYGFKNELLGRIMTVTQTDIPTPEEIIRRVARDRSVEAFVTDLTALGYVVQISDDAVLEIAAATQNPNFGMRVVPALVVQLKQHIVFQCPKGEVTVSRSMVKEILLSC